MYVLRSKLLGVDSDRSWKIQWFQYGAELGRSSKRDVLCIVLFLISSGAAIHAHGHKVFVQFVLRDDEFSPIRRKHHVSGGSSIAYSRNIRLHFPDSGAGARFPYEPLPCDRNFEFLSTGNFSSCAALLNCVRQFDVDGKTPTAMSSPSHPTASLPSARSGRHRLGLGTGVVYSALAPGRWRAAEHEARNVFQAACFRPKIPLLRKENQRWVRDRHLVPLRALRTGSPRLERLPPRVGSWPAGMFQDGPCEGVWVANVVPASLSLSLSSWSRQHERSFLPLFAHSARSVTGIYEAIDYVPCRRFDPLPPVPPPSGQLSRLSHENNVKVRPSAERAVPSFAGETNCRD
jgi:hypothetical protein